MNNHILKFISLALILFFTTSCSDSDEVSPLGGDVRLVIKSLEPLYESKVYSYQGKVVEGEKKDEFLNSLHWPSNLGLQFRAAELEHYRGMDLNYVGGVPSGCNGMNIIKTEKKEDDLFWITSNVRNEISEIDQLRFESGVLKYNYLLTAVGDKKHYNYGYLLREETNTVELSLISYKLVKRDENNILQSCIVDVCHNEFDDSMLSSLSVNDTLAVQEYRMSFVVYKEE